ncbi:MAG: glycosyltransferase family 2 protein [Bacteroidales bacterium]
MELSIIITVYNEEDNIQPMIERVSQAMGKTDYELIFVNDGSKDQTVERIKQFATDQVKLVSFLTNRGQSIAMRAGIDYAKGRYLAFLDGDLQNDPDDILPMLKTLKEESLDVVMGYRKDRKDNALIRNFPSKVANGLIQRVTGVKLKDGGCSIRVFKKEYAQGLDLYGELHRFIPVLTVMQGAKVKQVPVRHHERIFGVSKYGLSRIFKVLPDLCFIYFIKKFRLKPMHFFGNWAMSFLLISILALAGSFIQIFTGGTGAFFMLSAVFFVAAILSVFAGLMAEMQMRIYYQSEQHPVYIVKEVFEKESPYGVE